MTIYNRIDAILQHMATPYLDIDEASKIKYAEVFTPIWLIEEELDNCFLEEDFKNPNLKWLDPANGIGNYTLTLIKKLLIGLKDVEGLQDEVVRYKWIVENMIYVCEIQPMNMFSYLYFVDQKSEYKLNYFTGSYLDKGFRLHLKNVWKIDKIDRVIGNPPYQIKDSGAKASAKPIYNLFIEESIKLLNINGILSFITPSRWFGGGKGLDAFRKKMMQSKKISYIKHFQNEREVFGNNVRISGGVSYFRYDMSYNGNCLFNGIDIDLTNLDVIVSKTESLQFLTKILNKESIQTIFNPRSLYKIDTNDSRLEDTQINSNYVKCFVSQKRGFIKWIDITSLKKQDSTKWRVLTPRANGTAGTGFGNIFISKPGEFYNDTYISFIADTEKEAESIMSYLKTNFANYLLSVRKVSQDVSSETIKWIPLVPFDRIWNNDSIAQWFNLNDDDKKLIDFR
jgi:site-specific DNA-methyltransferase (adenine-specific)